MTKAWSISPSRRHIDHMLSDKNLHDIGFIPVLSEERRRVSESNLVKKRKLTAVAKKGMEGKAKGAADASKKKCQILPMISMLKGGETSEVEQAPKRTRITESSGVVTISEVGPSQCHSVAPCGEREISRAYGFAGVGDSMRGVSKYYGDPPRWKFDPKESPITPENGVEFLGQALGSLLDMEKRYEEMRGKYEKAKEKNSKLHDKIKRDRGINEALRAKFGEASTSYRRENVVDLFLISDECYENQRKTFDHVVVELKLMLIWSYLDFDFSEFDKEVETAF
ncbi:hypothetical protein EZV62_010376 [Acer yangbiense]|uniref:Uncharacterized protein n=1 Tax=Acer yangbiense TaxID=1000413 RepID=A0A5C7I4I6_9ROSI|nr:hypothetical protein EZV62_010376 [Acer yangbiense]